MDVGRQLRVVSGEANFLLRLLSHLAGIHLAHGSGHFLRVEATPLPEFGFGCFDGLDGLVLREAGLAALPGGFHDPGVHAICRRAEIDVCVRCKHSGASCGGMTHAV